VNTEFGIRNSESPPTPPENSKERKPCTVGLTGGLASGKSTVAQILGARGIPVFDADATVHALYGAGEAGAAAVAKLFGDAVLDSTGAVDRQALASRVLADEHSRLELEAAIHPLVRAEITRWIESLDGTRPAVVEAALLVETGSYRHYDVLLVVWCRRRQQLERALARGLSSERARGLIDAQFPLDEKRELADAVVDNSGEFEDLAQEVDRVWPEVVELCTDRRTKTSTS
jgi:dephospho-CoA kinase